MQNDVVKHFEYETLFKYLPNAKQRHKTQERGDEISSKKKKNTTEGGSEEPKEKRDRADR